MSFFNTSDNAPVTGSYDANPDIVPIPHGTICQVTVEEVSWSEYEGESSIEIKWQVVDGEYKARKLFQKVKVKNPDARKRDKAIRMLAAIDANAGGALMAAGTEPTDMDLANALMGKLMSVKVALWAFTDEDTGEVKKGNWISAVSGLNGTAAQQPQQAAKKDPVDDIGF